MNRIKQLLIRTSYASRRSRDIQEIRRLKEYLHALNDDELIYEHFELQSDTKFNKACIFLFWIMFMPVLIGTFIAIVWAELYGERPLADGLVICLVAMSVLFLYSLSTYRRGIKETERKKCLLELEIEKRRNMEERKNEEIIK